MTRTSWVANIHRVDGTIPAGAGSSADQGTGVRRAWDHPRGCGEQTVWPAVLLPVVQVFTQFREFRQFEHTGLLSSIQCCGASGWWARMVSPVIRPDWMTGPSCIPPLMVLCTAAGRAASLWRCCNDVRSSRSSAPETAWDSKRCRRYASHCSTVSRASGERSVGGEARSRACAVSTGTDSYRLASTRARAEHSEAG